MSLFAKSMLMGLALGAVAALLPAYPATQHQSYNEFVAADGTFTTALYELYFGTALGVGIGAGLTIWFIVWFWRKVN